MKFQNKLENNIVKTAILTLIIALICIIIPVAISTYAADAGLTGEIKVSQSIYNIGIGKTAQINAQISPSGKLIYTSADEGICTVDENGLITAVSVGSTVITVSAEDGMANPVECQINVCYLIDENNTEVRLEFDSYIYAGYKINPNLEVYYGETLLRMYKDYDINYTDNIDVGEGIIHIYGIGDYYGEIIKTFTIEQKDINDVRISDVFEYMNYKGTPLTPDIDAFLNWDYDSKLINGIDYTLSYENNINVGTATVTVKGIGNFCGEKTLDFIIYAADINNDVTVPSVEKVTYTGGALTPSVLPKIESYNLVLNKDYTVSYSNNVKIGTAYITITGIENVTGKRIIEFQIVPKANRLTSYGSSKRTTMKLKWIRSSGITGYKIYVYDSSKKEYVLKKTIKNPNTLTCTVTGLKAGKTYKFKIATFCTINGVNYISYLSTDVLISMTVPADSKIIQLNGANHSVQIRWKKISGVSGYLIYRYNKKTKKYVRIAKVKGNTKFTYTNKKLKKSRTYKYKVKAYKQLGGKTLKGKISAKKSVLTLSFRWPVPGFYYISQTYNNKSSMYASGSHSGTDIASKGKSIKGAKIIATKGGIVDSVNKGCKHNYGKTVSCGCGGGFGNYVVVRSSFKIDGKKVTLRVIYGHMTSVKVKVGQYISSGQLLGTVGSTGYSTGPHLHFEFRLQNSPTAKIKKRLNPLYYVKH